MKSERAFDFLFNQLERQPRHDCLCEKSGNRWRILSTQATVDRVNGLSRGLLGLGLQRGDHVAIAADNCVEWVCLDLALQQIGAISVPLYPTCTPEDARYILKHAEVKLAFAGSLPLWRKMAEALDGCCPLYAFVDLPDTPGMEALLHIGAGVPEQALANCRDQVGSDDVFTIIYTSGTTGRAKGVMLSHRNVVSTVESVTEHTGLPFGRCRALSFLPLSHIFERAGVLYYLNTATAVYFSTVEGLSSALAEIRPHTFSAVPRVLERVYDKLIAKAATLSPLRRRIYRWALALAEDFQPGADRGIGYALKFALAKKLVFSKWHAAMGGELAWVNVGSAALQPRLARLFWAAGIVVSEGYGMTEASPVISANPFNAQRVRIGTVGIAMPGVEIAFAEDGEILARGPNIMVGYYKDPEQTADVLRDGWLHTGDIGVIEDGYLRITDRKKEMFKTSNGKYIAPQRIENKLKESAFIDQVMIVGDGQRCPGALIVPLFEKLREWCLEQNIAYSCDREMALHPRIVELIDREIRRFNAHFGHWEHVRKFALLPEPWCVERGELAPTLKLRRKVITQHCHHVIEGMFAAN
ncbi:AMP-dependent synthetase/ligase [Paludibacterium yongneupense]|uniref:AMP-dependent synthetase/ligase n=1 Tax=Paludibacterium yongneupense TaxID=400061 RepID=UPI0004175E0C|nr:long-chain fatty acid--CoA ligase [Paludibacterium yongneupense]